MNIDFKLLQRELANNKVYDAWQYVQGLMESVKYASLSKELAEKLFVHRRETILEEARYVVPDTNGCVTFYTPLGKNPSQTIAGVEVDDAILMSKSTLDFFHYARMSIEVLSQIINAALFGDEAVSYGDKRFPSEVLKKIEQEQRLASLKNIITTALNDPEIKYLMDFDNYTKHVKNASFLIKNSFLFDNVATFKIKAFDSYSEEDAIKKMTSVFDATELYISNMINELLNQMANGRGGNNRFQTIRYKAQVRRVENKSYLDYVTFFIEVEHGIQDLPPRISVLPLSINNEGKVMYKPFPIDKIFITLTGRDEQGVCGVAELIAGQDPTALYQKFSVRGCAVDEYEMYIATFEGTYQKVKFPLGSPYSGEFIIYQEDGSAVNA